jgi:hypothetical protein
MAETPADLQIRPLGPDDDPEAQLDLAERAFGAMPAARPAGTAGPVSPAGPVNSAVTLGARGLAALYAGTSLVSLRQAGLAAGGTAADDAALDAAFAATPYMLDAF